MQLPGPIHLFDMDGSIALKWPADSIVSFLEGGYKAFKNWRNTVFNLSGPPIGIIAGKTGCGKTELLRCLLKMGRQVIDLEALALHRGSVFGGLADQPSNEQFQNSLLSLWLSFDPSMPVWIEEKGHLLGKLGIPETLYKKMTGAYLFELELPFQTRLSHVREEYADMDKTLFAHCIRKLEKRMGFSANHRALHYHSTGQVDKCLQLLLEYYDRAYDDKRNLFTNRDLLMKIDPSDFQSIPAIQKLESYITHKKRTP